jgi:hypothetical protein
VQQLFRQILKYALFVILLNKPTLKVKSRNAVAVAYCDSLRSE